MVISRRRFLQTAGITLIAVAGGVVVRSVDQGVFAAGQGPAYDTWRTWRSDAATPQERVVMAGILASNPHNSQPWLFRIEPDVITLYADITRQIGTIDPFLREMTIGLGCAVENMLLAARAEGLQPELQLMPDPTDRTQVARIALSAGARETSALYEAIPNRHTNRAAYDTTRALPATVFQDLAALNDETDVRLFWFESAEQRARFGDVAIRASQALVSDEQQSIDSHVWWRHQWAAIQQLQDGLTLDVQGLDDAILAAAKVIPDASRAQNDQTFVQMVSTVQVPSAAAFGIMAVRDGADAVQRLRTGQYWQRMHLWAATQGLAMQPLNQMCERVDREQQLGIEPEFGSAVQALLADADWTGIMPFRIGYPTRPTRLSPRRTLDKVLV